MKILVTNDDGIRAEGLKILVEEAKKFGEVLVVSPKVEQSGKSHAINVSSGIEITKYEDLFPGVIAYSVDSTPADCVRYAHYQLKYDFDVVFSGINNGYNVGEDILYSGTVAAATEAVFCGKKGIAFSCARGTVSQIQPVFKKALNYIIKNNILKYGNLFNVNFNPNSKDIVITHQGKTVYDTHFIVKEDGLYYQRGKGYFDLNKNKDSDVYAVNNDYISISPLTADRTNYSVFYKLTNHKW